MRDHLTVALEYERKAAAETNAFRAQCYRQLSALAVEAHAEQLSRRVRAGSPISDELQAMFEGFNARLGEDRA